MGSEVIRLQHQIEQECEAMNAALTGYATTARHAIIAQKYTQITTYYQQLEKLVGKQKAVELTFEIVEKLTPDPH